MLRKRLQPDEAAKRLFSSHIDAAQIWSDVCRLEPYSVLPAIACCEVAFARIAIIKFLCLHVQGEAAASWLCPALDRLTAAGFLGEDEETVAFYRMPLQQAALAGVRSYLPFAHLPAEIGNLLISRTGCERSLMVVETLATFGSEVCASLRRLRVRVPPNGPQSGRSSELIDQLRRQPA